jgi:hypothetical protein
MSMNSYVSSLLKSLGTLLSLIIPKIPSGFVCFEYYSSTIAAFLYELNPFFMRLVNSFFCGEYRSRTDDPLLAKQVL